MRKGLAEREQERATLPVGKLQHSTSEDSPEGTSFYAISIQPTTTTIVSSPALAHGVIFFSLEGYIYATYSIADWGCDAGVTPPCSAPGPTITETRGDTLATAIITTRHHDTPPCTIARSTTAATFCHFAACGGSRRKTPGSPPSDVFPSRRAAGSGISDPRAWDWHISPTDSRSS